MFGSILADPFNKFEELLPKLVTKAMGMPADSFTYDKEEDPYPYVKIVQFPGKGEIIITKRQAYVSECLFMINDLSDGAYSLWKVLKDREEFIAHFCSRAGWGVDVKIVPPEDIAKYVLE